MAHPKQQHDWKCVNGDCPHEGAQLTPDDFYYNGVMGRYDRRCKACVRRRNSEYAKMERGQRTAEDVIHYLNTKVGVKNRSQSLFMLIKNEKISRNDFVRILCEVDFGISIPCGEGI